MQAGEGVGIGGEREADAPVCTANQMVGQSMRPETLEEFQALLQKSALCFLDTWHSNALKTSVFLNSHALPNLIPQPPASPTLALCVLAAAHPHCPGACALRLDHPPVTTTHTNTPPQVMEYCSYSNPRSNAESTEHHSPFTRRELLPPCYFSNISFFHFTISFLALAIRLVLFKCFYSSHLTETH